jgi:hypothetical protein
MRAVTDAAMNKIPTFMYHCGAVVLWWCYDGVMVVFWWCFGGDMVVVW